MSTVSPERTSAAPAYQPVPRAADRGSGGWLIGAALGAFAIVVLGLFGLIGVISVWGEPGREVVSSTLNLSLREFTITGDTTAPAGNITLTVINNGSAEHNLIIPDLGIRSPLIGPGGSATVDLGEVAPGTYEMICDISGHESAGMVSELTVTAAPGDAPAESNAIDGAAAEGGDGHGDHEDYDAMDQAMMESIMAFPAETEGRGNPILEPTETLTDGTKVFDLTAEIVEWEVEPGRMVEAWTYNGVVPAPQILLDRGDRVKVRLVNNLPMGTDIHWHGVRTPNDQDGVAPITQELVAPDGGIFEYEFVATEDAIGMYHAHITPRSRW